METHWFCQPEHASEKTSPEVINIPQVRTIKTGETIKAIEIATRNRVGER